MTEPNPPPPAPPPQDNPRNRLWTRVMLIGFGVLVLAYIVATFVH
ncbi:hypothetical protein [Phenylobacterium hankyongense]|nr:hypothetical protein [Phenylobacterium hankyongense]